MGSLPPNVVSGDPRQVIAPRIVELYTTTRTSSFFPSGAEYGGVGPPLSGASFRYRSDTNLLAPWNAVRYDYEGSVARGNGISGSGPYLKGDPSSAIVYVTAPYSRPVPVMATFVGQFYHGGNGASETGGVAVARSKAGYPLTSTRILSAMALRAGNLSLGGVPATWERPTSLIGLDIVPPGQSYAYYVAWYSTDSGTYPVGARFNLSMPTSSDSSFRPSFTVMTL